MRDLSPREMYHLVTKHSLDFFLPSDTIEVCGELYVCAHWPWHWRLFFWFRLKWYKLVGRVIEV